MDDRDAKITRIDEGSTQAQWLVMARALLRQHGRVSVPRGRHHRWWTVDGALAGITSVPAPRSHADR